MPQIKQLSSGQVYDVEQTPVYERDTWLCGADNFYDPAGILYEPVPEPPPPADLRIQAVAFKRRMTQAERIAIRTLGATNAAIYDYMDLLASTLVVHLDDATVREGIQAMEAAGILAAGRAAQVLDTDIQPGERP